MRFIRLAVISFVVLFLLVTAISLFIPSRVRISRATNIKADPRKILTLIDVKADWSWYPGMDSATAVYWGEGARQEFVADSSSYPVYITIIKKDSAEVMAEVAAGKSRPVVNVWKVIGRQAADSATLQWYIDFHLRWYPWEKFASLLLDKSYGPVMEQGLVRLKKLAED